MTKEEEDRRAKDQARQERMAARQERMASRQREDLEAKLTDGTVATSVQAGAESIAMETPTSRNRSKAGYLPSFAGDDGAADIEAPPSNPQIVRPGAGIISPADPPLSRDMPKKDLSAVELQATLVDEEGEDQKLKGFVEEMDRRLQQQMQDLRQQQTQPQSKDLIVAIAGDADSASSAEEANRSKKRGIIVGVIVLVLVIGGGLAGFFSSQNDSNSETPLASNPTDALIVPGNPTPIPTSGPTSDPTSGPTSGPTSCNLCRRFRIVGVHTPIDGLDSFLYSNGYQELILKIDGTEVYNELVLENRWVNIGTTSKYYFEGGRDDGIVLAYKDRLNCGQDEEGSVRVYPSDWYDPLNCERFEKEFVTNAGWEPNARWKFRISVEPSDECEELKGG
jgi:hypothetical protein